MSRRIGTVGRLGAPLAVLALAPMLVGFSSAFSFDLDAELGGGGGYAFTGSPRSHGMSCATCHQSVEGTAHLSLTSAPPGLFTQGYELDTVYTIVVLLDGESHGRELDGACTDPTAGCNRNLFAAEVLSEWGTPAGRLCPHGDPIEGGRCASGSGEDVALLDDGSAVVGVSLTKPEFCADGVVTADCVDLDGLVASGAGQEEIAAEVSAHTHGARRWRFTWRAPASGSAPLRLYAAAVDGDGGRTVDERYADYYGDTVDTVVLDLLPAGLIASSEGAATGCQAGGSDPWWAALAGALLFGLLTARRWARRWEVGS